MQRALLRMLEMDAVAGDDCERSVEGQGNTGDVGMERTVAAHRVGDAREQQIVALAGFRGDGLLARALEPADRHVDAWRLVLVFRGLVLLGSGRDLVLGAIALRGL